MSAGTLLGDRYRLIRELGRGGMGSVWAGRDERLGRDVAVKIMAPRLAVDELSVARFEREAKAVARVSSPHIVQIHDYGHEPEVYMVMELLRGENLGERLARGQLELSTVVDMVTQCARGLAVAHGAGILHRDLKPGNIFVVDNGGADLYKLVDFGIAKAFRGNKTLQQLTAAGEISGTPKYMSPEQLRAKEDERDDVWALAVIAYRCLSGGHPYEADTLLELMQRIIDDEPTPILRRAAQLPPELDSVFKRAFHREREARFQTPQELAAALGSVGAPPASVAPSSQAPAMNATMLSATESHRAPTAAGAPMLTAAMSPPTLNQPPAPTTAPTSRAPWLALAVGLAIVAAAAGGFALSSLSQDAETTTEASEPERKKKKKKKASKEPAATSSTPVPSPAAPSPTASSSARDDLEDPFVDPPPPKPRPAPPPPSKTPGDLKNPFDRHPKPPSAPTGRKVKTNL